MSLCATRWAWKQDVSPSQKLVLLSMADRAGESHQCWPSVSRICKDTGLNRKTIMLAISCLEESGHLQAYRIPGAVTCYQLVGVSSREDEPVPKTGQVPKSAPVPKTGLHRSQKRDTLPVPKTGLHRSQKRDTESTSEPTISESTSESSRVPAGSKRPAPARAAKGEAIRRNGNHHEPSPGSLVWSAYATAYLERYGTEPVRNASVNAKLAAFAKRLPADEAPSVAAWYVNSGFSVYVRSKHCVDLMLRDAEGLRTEWATGTRMGGTEARRIDEHEASAEAVRWVSANAESLGLDPAWLKGKA